MAVLFRLVFAALALCLRFGLVRSQQSGAPPQLWSKYRGSLLEQGSSNVKSSLSSSTFYTPAAGWQYAAGASVASSPAFGPDGTIYFGADDRRVYALNGTNGYFKWSYATFGFVQSSPAISADGSTLYVGCNAEDETLRKRPQTTICCYATEGNSCNVTCPAGRVINQLNMVSFGNPAGTCNAPTVVGGNFNASSMQPRFSCDAAEAEAIVADPCIEQDSCSILASTDVFGDPCPGTPKALAIVASCVLETNTNFPRGWLMTGTPKAPKSNVVIGRISTLPANYVLTFQVYPLSDSRTSMRNILHLTNSPNRGPAQALPAVWFCDGAVRSARQRSLCITYYSNVGRDKVVTTVTRALPRNTWTTVTITIDLTELQTMRVKLSGAVRQSLSIPFRGFTPSQFTYRFVSVFLSDAFFNAARCLVRSVTVSNNFDSFVYAINTARGTLKWQYRAAGYVLSSPAISADGNTIYVGTMNNTLVALNTAGSALWVQRSFTDSVQSSPAVASDGNIYVGCDDNSIYAISPRGSLIWSQATGGWIFGAPAISSDGTTLYVASADTFLYAYRIAVVTTGTARTPGSLIWRIQTLGALLGGPAISPIDGNIVVATEDGFIYCFLPDGISTKFMFDISTAGNAATSTGIFASPVIDANGWIFVGSDNGGLYALTSTGSLAWVFQTGGAIVSDAAIGLDGNFYLGSGDTRMYQISRSLTQGSLAVFNYTGAMQAFTVPPLTFSVTITAFGAQAANPGLTGNDARKPGMGGMVQATFAVTPGQVLYVNVGQQPPGNGDAVGAGGYNGGGVGRCGSGGGGGASDVQIFNKSSPTGFTKIVVAGGGGGCGYYGCMGDGYGGVGGGFPPYGLAAGDGSVNTFINGPSKGCSGLAGSQFAGGAGGTSNYGAGFAGSWGLGGGAAQPASADNDYCSAGGGGGYYGGGGSADGCGAGGGSSFVAPNALPSPPIKSAAGVRMGSGQVIISTAGAPTATPTRIPSPAPSSIPSPLPVANPTREPTVEPSPAPSNMPTPRPTRNATCGSYTATTGPRGTFDSNPNLPVCGVRACPGNSMFLTTCPPSGSCTGDTFLRLFDASGNEVANNDDGASPGCGKCAEIFYVPPPNAPCQIYIVREGCGSETTCGGKVFVGDDFMQPSLTILPTPQPSFAPSYAPGQPVPQPTATPTFVPTLPPTFAPTGLIYTCSLYQVSATNFDRTSRAACGVQASARATFTVSMCSAYFPNSRATCTGNTQLRLLDPTTGFELPVVETQDWSCGTCAQITYTVPAGTPTQTYVVAEGCNGFGDCSGTAVIAGSIGIRGVTYSPTASPTLSPTYLSGTPTPGPTPEPTAAQTSAAPTQQQLCPFYISRANTASDTLWNEPVCGIRACRGQTISASMCGGLSGTACTGLTTLRVSDELTGVVVAADDPSRAQLPSCQSNPGSTTARCASLTFTVPTTIFGCRRYLLQEGCLRGSTCSGRVAVTGLDSIFLPNPTAVPTLAPTYLGNSPTPLPTIAPSARPTSSPTLSPTRVLSCRLYQSPTNTQNDMVDVPVCGIVACATQPFTVSMCNSQYPAASCTGNTFLRLFDSTNSLQLARNDNGFATGCGQCAQLTYTPPANSGCQLYLIREGCSGTATCSGTAIVSGAAMNVINYPPTLIPTPAPSYLPGMPTPLPTMSPTGVRRCSNMFTSTSGSPATCGVRTCGGQTITISLCSSNYAGAFCTGNPSLSLRNTFGTVVQSNDNGPGSCGLCSQLTYTAPATAPCQVYTIVEQCLGTAPCSGSAIVSGTSFNVVPFAPTFFPTSAPSFTPGAPTPDPSAKPTAFPSISPTPGTPSFTPSPPPSPEPTTRPSPVPSLIPSARPSPFPTSMPSTTMTCPPYTASKTNGALVNTPVCGVSACTNTTFLATTCISRISTAACSGSGNTMLRIYNQAGVEVKYDTLAAQPNSVLNGCPCGSTVQYTTRPSDGCQVFTIREGCTSSGTCSGTVAIAAPQALGVSIIPFPPTAVPTSAPTYLLQNPTPVPSSIPTTAPTISPTPRATLAPTSIQFQCALYSVAATFNDGVNQPVCGVTASAGQTFTVSLCGGNFPGASCSGNTYMRLFGDASGTGNPQDVLAVSDTGEGDCSTCAQMTYTVPAGMKTQTFLIREGCDIAGLCSGVAVIAGTPGIQLATYAPTSLPTTLPTFVQNAPTPGPTSVPSTAPTPGPSALPTVTGTLSPVSGPSTPPTPGPTFSFVRCNLFGAVWAAGLGRVNPQCTFQLCGGRTVNITTCPDPANGGAFCTGNPSLKLLSTINGVRTTVISNDNGRGRLCGLCPALSYTAPGSSSACQIYSLQEVCSSSTGGTCTGVATLAGVSLSAGSPTPAPVTAVVKTPYPTLSPTYLPNVPTPAPSVNIFPTSLPTLAPTNAQFCPPFSVSNTNSASDPVNTAQCSIVACGGQTVTIGGCPIDSLTGINNGMSCFGDTWLKLINPQGIQVAENDDGCGACASITFLVPYVAPTLSQCQIFIIRQGCYENTVCSGTTSVLGGSVIATMFPTNMPTAAPTLQPTSLPTMLPGVPTPAPTIKYGTPTLRPSAAPTLQVQSCKLYGAAFTNSGTQNYQACGVYACAGATFTVSTCTSNYGGVGATCTGDTFLSLYSDDDTLMISNDNGPSGCGLCSQFTFTATLPCQTYIIREGCYGDDICTGTAVIGDQYNDVRLQTFSPTKATTSKPTRLPTAEPTLSPTIGPTLAPTYTKGSPTPQPSASPTNPTFKPSPFPTLAPVLPTPAPTNPLICPPYADLSNTQSALVNYAVCSIDVCPGATLTMGGCPANGGMCQGDQYLRLYDSTQTQVAYNDDAPGCGNCASITYTFTLPCQTYRLVQGCFDSATCGGVSTVIGAGIFNLADGVPTSLPTQAPQLTLPPSFPPKNPTPSPTAVPSFLPAAGLVTCNLFQADYTGTDMYRFGTCGVFMCAGATVTMSLCSALDSGAMCTGDTYLKLFNPAGTLVAENGDGPTGCGLCSQITFTATGPCQHYTIAEGCVGADHCSGTLSFKGTAGTFQIATFNPTPSPTSMPPSPNPTNSPTYLPGVPTPGPTPGPTSPTFKPTPAPSAPTLPPSAPPTMSQFCPPFSVANTNNALDGSYATCTIRVCEGSTLTAGNCDASGTQPGLGCAGDQYFRLYDPAGINIVSNNNACGYCSQVVYNPPPGSGCQVYTLREGCYGMTGCSGVVAVAGGSIVAMMPSKNPTPAPSSYPTPYIAGKPTTSPAFIQTPSPTSAPFLQPLYCPTYMAINTNDGQANFATCGIYACAGVTFTVSTCTSSPGAYCSGDTFLSLWNQNNTMITSNDDGPTNANCNLCSQFTVTVTGPCQTYTLRQACAANDACTGKAVVSGDNRDQAAIRIVGFAPTQKPTQNVMPTPQPSSQPTLAPSFGPSMSPTYLPGVPTPNPTAQPSSPSSLPTPQPSNPTAHPTLAPTFALMCPPFDATKTNYAYANYAICSFYACPGTLISAGNCIGDSVAPNQIGDSYIRLFDAIGYQVAENDDACGLGSQITYVTTLPCQTYALHQGCFGDSACSGIMSILPSPGIALNTIIPSQFPTALPSPYYVPRSPTLAPAPLTPAPTVPTATALCTLFTNLEDTPYQHFPSCSFYACPGTQLHLTTCSASGNGASCSGGVYFKLFDSSNQPIYDNYGLHNPQCHDCPELSFTTLDTCQTYSVREGCEGTSCSATLQISGLAGSFTLMSRFPTSAPVNQPTFPPVNLPTPEPSAFPTPSPTALPDVPTAHPTVEPTPVPTHDPTGPTFSPTPLLEFCHPYHAANTTYASGQSTPLCTVKACPGEKLVIGSCQQQQGKPYLSTCNGDQYLRLTDPNGLEVAQNDDACGLCSQINYQVPIKVPDCKVFTIHMGCYGNSACTGEVSVSGGTLDYVPGTPTLQPSPHPSPEPTHEPSASPTEHPSALPTHDPSEHPSPVPSDHPTASPTFAPTPGPTAPSPAPSAGPTTGFKQPSAFPTVAPSAHPSTSPTPMPSSAPSADPTASPTPGPTPSPSANPTFLPTSLPTSDPTAPSPVPSAGPTTGFKQPSAFPTVAPSAHPSTSPTPMPSSAPSADPTASSTPGPTPDPSSVPSALPTSAPTLSPSANPTVLTTTAPTPIPTAPSPAPSASPTTGFTQPSAFPTFAPSTFPSASPTPMPSSAPSEDPTALPTPGPTPSPSVHPTTWPSPGPTPFPSVIPTVTVTPEPTSSFPTPVPTVEPSLATTGPTQTGIPTGNTFLNCPAFSVSATNNGLNRGSVSVCGIFMGGGTTILLSDCPKRGYQANLRGKSVFRLYNGQGVKVGENTATTQLAFQCSAVQSCTCSEISYTTPQGAGDQVYTLEQGCVGQEACGGTTAIVGYSGFRLATVPPSAAPTATPFSSKAPTSRPTPRPTELPTRKPSPRPSLAPSRRPSPVPSAVPSLDPTAAPSSVPTYRPSHFGDTRDPTNTPAPTARATRSAAPSKSSAPTMDFSGADIYNTSAGSSANPNPIWGDDPTGSGFGSVLAWSGTTLFAGASDDNNGAGMVEVFNCGPYASNTISPFQCAFGAKILNVAGPAAANAEFGWDIKTSGKFVAIAAPGSQQVLIYTVSALQVHTAISGRTVPPLATINGLTLSATSEFARSIALCVLPGGDSEPTTSTHNGVYLIVGDGMYVNKPSVSTGIVYVYFSVSDAKKPWSQVASLTSPTLGSQQMAQDNLFGDNLAMNSQGILAVGVGSTGSVYTYDCVFEGNHTCLPLKGQDVISPLAPVTVSTTDQRVIYTLALNKNMLIVGQPSTNSDVGTVYMYAFTTVTGSPSPRPTVAPSRTTRSRSTAAPTNFYDSYRFVLSQTLVPDVADSNGNFSAFFGASVTANDNSYVAVGSPGSKNGFGTVYLYNCPDSMQCNGKGGKVYFQKLDCFDRQCQQGVDYASQIALSQTGALIAKGNEGASKGTVKAPTDNGNIQLWWADNRIPLTYSPTPLPTLAPTPAPSALPTLGPTSIEDYKTPVPTPTINSPDRFNCFFTVAQQFSGPSLDMGAVSGDMASVNQTLQLTIAEVWTHPFDTKVNSDGVTVPICLSDVQITSIVSVPASQVKWRPKDPKLRRLQDAGGLYTIAVSYRVTFDYISMGWASQGYYALFQAMVRELNNDITQDTAITNKTAGLAPQYFEESWFTQHMRYNAPDGSCLKSADAAETLINTPELVALTPAPSPMPSMPRRVNGTEAPSSSTDTSSSDAATPKSKANITLISSVTVVAFVVAIAVMYFYRKWLLEQPSSGKDSERDDEYQFRGDYDQGHDQAINPIYSSDPSQGARIEFDGSAESSAFRRASGWSSPSAMGYPPAQQQMQMQQQQGIYESPTYMDQSNPGFKIVQRASLIPNNPTTRASFSRLNPGMSISPPAAPPLMAPPVAPVNPLTRSGGRISFGMPQNLPQDMPMGSRLKPFAPHKSPAGVVNHNEL